MIDYAPCMTGFDEGKPVIIGVVVHDDNADVLREAMGEMNEILREAWTARIAERWERLVVKVLLDKRLDDEWGREKAGSSSSRKK